MKYLINDNNIAELMGYNMSIDYNVMGHENIDITVVADIRLKLLFTNQFHINGEVLPSISYKHDVILYDDITQQIGMLYGCYINSYTHDNVQHNVEYTLMCDYYKDVSFDINNRQIKNIMRKKKLERLMNV